MFIFYWSFRTKKLHFLAGCFLFLFLQAEQLNLDLDPRSVKIPILTYTKKSLIRDPARKITWLAARQCCRTDQSSSTTVRRRSSRRISFRYLHTVFNVMPSSHFWPIFKAIVPRSPGLPINHLNLPKDLLMIHSFIHSFMILPKLKPVNFFL
jgi:hypothetical protein